MSGSEDLVEAVMTRSGRTSFTLGAMKCLKPQSLLSLFLAILLSVSLLPGCSPLAGDGAKTQQATLEQSSAGQARDAGDSGSASAAAIDLASVPAYSSSPYVELSGNEPQFTDEDKGRGSFEEYSPLDSLGRCGVAFALIGTETMPTEERGNIGSVRPSGWHTVRYNGIVDGNYLYNRCHLIGYQLAGENANTRNLITGTRYLNVEGMLPFEDEVADYVERTGNHVLYRVTPVFEGDNLVASGMQMEAWSVEDGGRGVSFDVFCYNVQPGIDIDYATGDSSLAEEASAETASGEATEASYVLNTGTERFHLPSCSSVAKMKRSNRQSFTGTRQELIDQGYSPCGECNP